MIANQTFNFLMERIERFQQVSVPLKLAIEPLLKVYERPKGEMLFNFGKRSPFIWFLATGFAREISHNVVAGSARTSWFWYQGDFLFAHPAFFSNQTAFTDIELLSDVTLLEMSYESMLLLRQQYSEFNLLVERLRAECEMDRFQHAADLITLSATARVKKFYDLHKALLQVARQKDINEFLGLKHHSFYRYLK